MLFAVMSIARCWAIRREAASAVVISIRRSPKSSPGSSKQGLCQGSVARFSGGWPLARRPPACDVSAGYAGRQRLPGCRYGRHCHSSHEQSTMTRLLTSTPMVLARAGTRPVWQGHFVFALNAGITPPLSPSARSPARSAKILLRENLCTLGVICVRLACLRSCNIPRVAPTMPRSPPATPENLGDLKTSAISAQNTAAGPNAMSDRSRAMIDPHRIPGKDRPTRTETNLHRPTSTFH
jgi:hypothetical protein